MDKVLSNINDYFIMYDGSQELDESDGRDKKVIKLLIKFCSEGEKLAFNALITTLLYKKKGFVLTDKQIIDIEKGMPYSLDSISGFGTVDDTHIYLIVNNNKIILQTFGEEPEYNINREPSLEKNNSVLLFLSEYLKRYKKNQKKEKKNDSKDLKARISERKTQDIEVKEEKMFCPFCGKQINRISKFCSYCGKTNSYNKS